MRLIDADALINTLQELFDRRSDDARFTGSKVVDISWNDAIYHIADAPTIDAVPVVRCRECIHWYRCLSADGKIEYFNLSGCEKMHAGYPDFFCKDGQRREDVTHESMAC